MRKKYFLTVFIILILFDIGASIWVVNDSTNKILGETYSVLGEEVENIATLLSDSVKLSDSDVEKLKNLDYSDSVTSEENTELNNYVNHLDLDIHIRYVYILTKLDESEIKYAVTQENSELYKTEVGTPLNMVRLLDVIYKKNDYTNTQTSFDEYDNDINRYSYMHDCQKKLFTDIKSTYTRTDTELGDYITGYVPIYTNEGNFIGYFGVDVLNDEYSVHKDSMIKQIIYMFGITVILLTALLIYFYSKYNKMVLNKVYHDPLTNVYNRIYFDKYFPKMFRKSKKQGQSISVLMIDIDYLKSINDSYGHQVGDKCIIGVAQIFEKYFSSPSSFVHRYGGEEFMAVAFEWSDRKMSDAIKKMMAEISELHFCPDGQKLSVSIGVASISQDKADKYTIEEMISAADENLYKSKKNGRAMVTTTDLQ